jgi:hypothetical protein
MDNKESDKRKEQRIGLEIKIRLTPIKGQAKVYGWIQDLSKEGLKLKTVIPSNLEDIIHKGDKVIFETYEDFFRLRGRGGIIWTSMGDNVVGIKFDELDEKSRKALEEFLKICF